MTHPARGVLGSRIGRLSTDGRRGHSLERTVFRKCTFGAKRRLSPGGSGTRHSSARYFCAAVAERESRCHVFPPVYRYLRIE